jgi:hypothetical protein
MNPYQAYLNIPFEVDARHAEHQHLSQSELTVFFDDITKYNYKKFL